MSRLPKICLALWLAASSTLLFCTFAVAEDAPLDASAQAQPAAVPAPQKPAAAADDGWHFAITPYLWFAGLSGTAGVRGHYASLHASPGDLLSHFRIGLMANVEARKGRLVLPLDFLWMKLGDDKSVPFDQGVASVNVGITETLLTPKIGYRVVDREKIKVDALVGFRYWYLGQSLNFSPQLFNGISTSASWVDAVGGAKIEMALSPKASVTISGDAGGGGANSDYQVATLLGYKVKPTVSLVAGWRYIDVNYRSGAPKLFIYDAHSSGAVIGATFNIK